MYSVVSSINKFYVIRMYEKKVMIYWSKKKDNEIFSLMDKLIFVFNDVCNNVLIDFINFLLI